MCRIYRRNALLKNIFFLKFWNTINQEPNTMNILCDNSLDLQIYMSEEYMCHCAITSYICQDMELWMRFLPGYLSNPSWCWHKYIWMIYLHTTYIWHYDMHYAVSFVKWCKVSRFLTVPNDTRKYMSKTYVYYAWYVFGM